MKGSIRNWALTMFCLLLGGTACARAAGTYTLSCEPARGETFTIALTGFNFKVTGGGVDAATGAARGGRSSFELSVQFALSKDYSLLASMAEDNEVLRSCKLTVGDVGGGITASDSWNAAKAKNQKGKNAPGAASSGGFEWILTNAMVSNVSVVAAPNASGVTESSVEATIEAQKYVFTM